MAGALLGAGHLLEQSLPPRHEGGVVVSDSRETS